MNYISLSRGELVVRTIRESEGACTWERPTSAIRRFNVSPATSEDAHQVAKHPATMRFAGIMLGHVTWQRGGRELFAIIPAWLPSLLLGVPPAIWLVRVAARHRAASGHCSNCNYDLRATPERCPECGTVCDRVVAVATVDGGNTSNPRALDGRRL